MCNLCVISPSLAPSKILPYCLGTRSFVHVILRCVARFSNCVQFVRKPLYLPVSESMKLFVVVSGLLLYAEVGFI